MTTIVDDFVESKQQYVKSILARPGMYAPDPGSMYSVLGDALEDLAFFHGSKEELTRLTRALQGRFNKYGVPGIQHWFKYSGRRPDSASVVASLCAEIANRLGFLESEHALTQDEWQAIGIDDLSRFENRDWTIGEVSEALPPASLRVGNTLCYAPPDEGGWVFFDFETAFGSPEERQQARLRAIRLPSPRARKGLVLTPYGQSILVHDEVPDWEFSRYLWLRRAKSALALASHPLPPDAAPADLLVHAHRAALRALQAEYTPWWAGPHGFSLGALIDMQKRHPLPEATADAARMLIGVDSESRLMRETYPMSAPDVAERVNSAQAVVRWAEDVIAQDEEVASDLDVHRHEVGSRGEFSDVDPSGERWIACSIDSQSSTLTSSDALDGVVVPCSIPQVRRIATDRAVVVQRPHIRRRRGYIVTPGDIREFDAGDAKDVVVTTSMVACTSLWSGLVLVDHEGNTQPDRVRPLLEAMGGRGVRAATAKGDTLVMCTQNSDWEPSDFDFVELDLLTGDFQAHRLPDEARFSAAIAIDGDSYLLYKPGSSDDDECPVYRWKPGDEATRIGEIRHRYPFETVRGSEGGFVIPASWGWFEVRPVEG